MERLWRGALYGVAGTLVMSLVILAGRALQLLIVLPPRQIAARTERKTGIGQHLPTEGFQARWLLAHFGFGALLGAIYTLIRPILRLPTVAAGLVYGFLAWAANYLGLMPALGLYPWPKDDSKTRLGVMIVAHLVFGLVTAEAKRWLEWWSPRPMGESLP